LHYKLLVKRVLFSSTQLKNGGEDLCGEEESMRKRAGERGMLTKKRIDGKMTSQWSNMTGSNVIKLFFRVAPPLTK
jgi:hypothetical protein